MNYNLVIILVIIFNLFYTNGKPEPDPQPQYVPKYLKDSYDLPSSHVPHLNADFSLGFGHRNKRDVATSGVNIVNTNGQSQSGVNTVGGVPYRGGCMSPPIIHNSQTKCSLYSGCRSSCLGDYKFPNGQTTLFITCVERKWEVEGTDWKNIPSCERCTRPPSIPNAITTCSLDNRCRSSCVENYQFPNGQTRLRSYITCAEGKWEVEGTDWETIPSCEPICSPACSNNGTCIAPNHCYCPENYSDAQCQAETKHCVTIPPIPINSVRKCSRTSCTVTCMTGYQFSDGSTIANMVCSNGFWEPAKSEWSQIPDCEATCSPPCQNGGNCLSLNVCQCPQAFRGPQCQYSINACNARKLKLNFNGGYKCSGNGELFWCMLRCPEGIEFTFTPAQNYTCDYAVGVFLPQPMPQCVFDSGLEVIPTDGDTRNT